MTSTAARRYAPWLWLLLGLFVIRVIAQPVVRLVGASFLPPFDAWQSGILPYPVLVATQLVIIMWLARTAWIFTTRDVTPSRRLGLVMVACAGAYFALMVARLVLGATVLQRQRWFASPVPTLFHLVLAAYLLLFGYFHYRHSSS